MGAVESIVFISLFLGVAAGPKQVEVAVDANVAAVELRLDGAVAARIDGPPWAARVDLGPELAPHHLEAVAFDAAGGEVGRAEQWVNLPRRRHELRLLLERDAGRVVGGRLAWDSVEFDAPASLRLSFDGRAIATDDAATFTLPRHAADELHVVSAEAVFPDGATARADAVFGGRYGEQSATELTAVPLLAAGRLPRRPHGADGWLAVDGRPARVVAIDRGTADLYAVLDESAGEHLGELAAAIQRRVAGSRTNARLRSPPPGVGLPSGSPLYGVGLRADDRLFLVNPRVQKATSYDLFGVTLPLDAADGGSAWQLATRRFVDAAPGRPQRLADAVATAALAAVGGGRPRAVVLILGPQAADRSLHPPATVRRFLDRLRVPLAVWYVEQLDLTVRQAREAAVAAAEARQAVVPPGVEITPERVDEEAIAAARQGRLAAARERWGEVTDVDGLAAWMEVCGELRQAVGRQAVLWIEGAHAPGEVTLGEAPAGVRLLAAGDLR